MKNLVRLMSCLLIASMLCIIKGNGQSAEIKIDYQKIDKEKYSVRLMIRSRANSSFNLASQNYRLYYNDETIDYVKGSLNSQLSKKLYSDATLIEHLNFKLDSGFDKIGNIKSLGFLNFEISLTQSEQGGAIIGEAWKEVISFHVLTSAEFVLDDLILSQRAVTDELATAFIELSEWMAPYSTRPLNIQISNAETVLVANDLNIEIGPNPTVDFVLITALEDIKKVRVFDQNGFLLKSLDLSKASIRLDLSGQSNGIYTIQIEGQNGDLALRKIVKINASI